MTRRYQNGGIELYKTAQGPAWCIRFTGPDGRRLPRIFVGLKSELPTKVKASRAAQPHREAFNDPSRIATPTIAAHTFGDVVRRYELEEIPERFSTRQGYERWHRGHIMPKWGDVALDQVEAIDVRAWLRNLQLSTRSKGHVHGQMKTLFKFAMLWKWIPAAVNPMSLFSIEGATKRSKAPRVISPAQFRLLIAHFKDVPDIGRRMQVLIIAAYCLGLRVSELFALQWQDFDHLGETVRICRAVVQGHVGDVKTERSEAPLPLDKFVGDAFLNWRQESIHKEPEDWVFASPYREGRMPMDSNNLQAKVLIGAGKAIGLDFNLGWHTLRHSYKSLLDRVTADASLKRDLMRHADVHTTMQTYGEVEMDRLRVANSAAVALALSEQI